MTYRLIPRLCCNISDWLLLRLPVPGSAELANFLTKDRQERLARALMRGRPQRTIAEDEDIDRKTVARHARWLGRTARHLLMQQTALTLRYFQMDEFYSYVLAKAHNAADIKSPVVLAGRFLHFLAVESDTGFIVSHMVAPSNGVEDTRRFIKDFDARLARNPDGSYVHVPELITDGHGSYGSVIKEDGYPYNYGKFIKESTYETKDGRTLKKRMFGGIRREIVQGTLRDPDGFNTQMNEAVNSSARARNMRVHKKSKAGSKRFAQHCDQFSLWAWGYNYAFVQERRKQTPAMAAGIDQRLWQAPDLIRAAEIYREEFPDALDEIDPILLDFDIPEIEIDDPNLIWLYHSLQQKASKAHHPDCRWCNQGAGVKGYMGTSGIWLPFKTLDEARVYGEQATPGNFTLCRDCFHERNFWRGRL